MKTDILINNLKNNKPRNVCIDADASDLLLNPDCLSIQATVFRNGGMSGGRDAIRFVELTPELLAFFRAIY